MLHIDPSFGATLGAALANRLNTPTGVFAHQGGMVTNFGNPGQNSTGSEIPHKRVYYCQRCLNHGRIEPRKNHKTDCIYANCDCEKCILVERRRVLNTQLHELEEQDGQKHEPHKTQDSASPTLDQTEQKDTETAENSQTDARDSSLSGSNSPLSVIGRSRSNTMFNVGGASGMDGFFFGTNNSMAGQNQPNQSSSSSPTSSAMYGGIGRMKGERVPNCQKCAQHGKKARLKGHKRYCAYKDCSCAKCQVISERQRLMADQIKIRRRQSKDTWMKLRRERLGTTHIGSTVEMAPSMDFTAKPMESESSNANVAVSPLAMYLQNLSQLYRTLMEPSEAPTTVPPTLLPQIASMEQWTPKSATSSPPSSMISNSIFSDTQGYRKFPESLSLPALSQALDPNSFLQSLVQPRASEMEVKTGVSSSSPLGHSASPTAMETLSRILQQQIQPPTTAALATFQGSPDPLLAPISIQTNFASSLQTSPIQEHSPVNATSFTAVTPQFLNGIPSFWSPTSTSAPQIPLTTSVSASDLMATSQPQAISNIAQVQDFTSGQSPMNQLFLLQWLAARNNVMTSQKSSEVDSGSAYTQFLSSMTSRSP